MNLFTEYTLRPYQEEAADCVLDHLSRVASTLVVMATGLGKTVLFSHVARRMANRRIVVMAHREELISQAAEKIAAVFGEPPAIEMGEEYSDEQAFTKAKVVVTSVQTMCRPRRFSRFKPTDFGLLIIDEAHHAPAKTYRRVIDHFRMNCDLRVLGVTATPKRTDKLAMGNVFDTVAFQYDIDRGVSEGWLVPVKQQVVVVENLDFSKIKTLAGDFNQKELEDIVSQESILHAMAAPTVEMAGDEPTLVFCVGVKQAAAMHAVLNRYKPESAQWISGDKKMFPTERRRQIITDFKERKFQFLCNCAVLGEGFDCPDVRFVVMGRPTKSLAIYVQALGRGTRPLPGVVDGRETAEARREAIAVSEKTHMTVLDFVGNVQRHAKKATITAVDVLGGKYGNAVRDYANKNIQNEGKPVSIDEAMERAEDELTWLDELEVMDRKRQKVTAKPSYRIRDYSARDPGAKRTFAAGSNRDPATPKQIWKLMSLGISRGMAESYTKKQASAVISKKLAEREGKAG